MHHELGLVADEGAVEINVLFSESFEVVLHGREILDHNLHQSVHQLLRIRDASLRRFLDLIYQLSLVGFCQFFPERSLLQMLVDFD